MHMVGIYLTTACRRAFAVHVKESTHSRGTCNATARYISHVPSEPASYEERLLTSLRPCRLPRGSTSSHERRLLAHATLTLCTCTHQQTTRKESKPTRAVSERQAQSKANSTDPPTIPHPHPPLACLLACFDLFVTCHSFIRSRATHHDCTSLSMHACADGALSSPSLHDQSWVS